MVSHVTVRPQLTVTGVNFARGLHSRVAGRYLASLARGERPRVVGSACVHIEGTWCLSERDVNGALGRSDLALITQPQITAQVIEAMGEPGPFIVIGSMDRWARGGGGCYTFIHMLRVIIRLHNHRMLVWAVTQAHRACVDGSVRCHLIN
jgi:hypothetical protein